MYTKKITSAFLAAAVAFGSVLSAVGKPMLNSNSYISDNDIVVLKDDTVITLGDADINGTVDASDASLILSEYSSSSTGGASTFTPAQKKSSDVDKNGTIDAVDASYVLAYYAYVATGGKLSIIEFINGEQAGTTTTAPVTTTTTKKPATTTTKKPVTTTTKKPATTTTKKPATTTKKPATTTTKAPVTTTTKATTTEIIRVTGIRVTRNEMLVNAGEGSLAAHVSMIPDNAPNVAEIWKSSDESIAIVDSEGWVTGVSEGECVVTVTSVDNPDVFAEIKVTVKDIRSVKTIKLSRAEATIEAGTGALAARVTMLPETAINKNEIWTSSKPDIATVDNEGWVTAIKPGNTIITVRSEDNPAVFSFVLVTVVDSSVTTNPPVSSTTTTVTTPPATTSTVTTSVVYVPVESITLKDTEIDLTVGGKYEAMASVAPENASDKSLKWTSTDESIAAVDENGKITAKSAGKCIITAISKDNPAVIANIVVNVKHGSSVTEIRLDKYEMTIPVGGTDIAWVTMLPAAAENKDELWASSDSSIASVDKFGWVYGNSVGECVITVFSVDNTDVMAEIKVTVTDGPVEPPKYTFSQIAPGKSTNTEIAFLTPIPANASGRFVIDYMITDANGQVTKISTPTILAPATTNIITMLTAGTNHFTAEAYLTNLANAKMTKIGEYSFTINPRNAKTEEEAIENAFAAVGGLE